MRFNLASLTLRAKHIRRKSITLRPIALPSTLATDLYQSTYAAVIATWGEALPEIMASYERTLAELQTDAPADTGAQLSAVERRITAAALTLRLRLERWARRLEAAHRAKWRAAVLSGTGVDLDTMIGPNDARLSLEAVIERNVSLISSVSDQAKGRISDAVFRGFRERKAANDVAKELREAVDMGRTRARRIAADQTVKLARELDQERRRQAGIDTWAWVHSGKAHPREEHLARDGEIYSDDDPPLDMPGELPFCGCTSKAVLDIDAMIEKELAAAA
jgi:SPP1 gp7 family putative phage head morphogenesis protein